VAGTWGLFKQSLHLLFDGVPEGVDMVAVRGVLLALPGVAGVHDLHVWAMGSAQTALTAHLVLSGEGVDTGGVLLDAEHALHTHFEIRHVTLQLESTIFAQQCALRAGAGCS